MLGLVFLAYLAGTVSSAVAGRLADRVGRPRVLAGSTLLMGAGVLLTLPDRLPLVVLGLVVLTSASSARTRRRAAGRPSWAPGARA